MFPPMDQLIVFLPGIFLAYAAYLLSIVSPGPNILSIMGTSMAVGRSSGVALALGVSTGSFIWAVLSAAGLSALLSTYAQALIVIKIVGGLYLLWLAYKSFRAAAKRHDTAAAPGGNNLTLRRYFLRGLTVQMTNPKALLAWIAIMSLGLQQGAPMIVAAAIVIGTTALAFVLHGTYALAFSTQPMVRVYAKARRGIHAALGTFFAVAGLKLLSSRG